MPTIEAFEPILTHSISLDSSPSQLLVNIIAANTNYTTITDHIHAVLLLNTLQHLLVERIFDHIIRNNDRLCITKEDKLLSYMRGEERVGKSCVIHA